MKNTRSLIGIAIIFFLFTACTAPYKFELSTPKTLIINEKLTITVSEKDNHPIDSVRYYLDGQRLTSNTAVDVSNKKLGAHAVSATVFFGDDQKQLTNTIRFLSAKRPDIYTYEVINAFPHDNTAFTQGLEFYNGFIYESTGQYGKSTLRKVDLSTGNVLQKTAIDSKYFGEGMTIFNDKIYLLTWQSKKGFIFDITTFDKKGEFNYARSKEGWGLTHTSQKLLKTDGTEHIWTLDPTTLKEESSIQAYTHKDKVDQLNEIEYINGKIYANKWQANSIVIINASSGAIEGIVDLNGLQTEAGQKGTDNVLNGIAYDAENDRLFVTGKNWNKLFEIKLSKKQ